MREQFAGRHSISPAQFIICICLCLMPVDMLLAQDGSVARAQFATDVTNREPVDSIAEISNSANKVHFFTELTSMTGATVVHRWIYKNSVAAEVSFDVKGPRWRVYSSKQLNEWMTGDWVVEIVVDDEPLEEKYTLSVIDNNQSIQASGNGSNKSPTDLPPEILDLRELFPDTQVVVLASKGDVNACQPANQFKWQRISSNHWRYQMADTTNLAVHLGSDSQPQSNSTTVGNCIHQTSHRIDHDNKELIIENVSSCTDVDLPVMSVTSLKRKGDELDLFIFSDTMSHCRYGLSTQ